MSERHVHPHGELHNPDTAHETTDINIGAIVTFVVALTAITLAIQVAMWGMFKILEMVEEKSDPQPAPFAAAPATRGADFPAPSLQTTPWTDLRLLRADEAAYLHSYGWVDQQAGIARVPIEKAKELLLKKGLPVRPDVADPSEGTRIAATGESSGGRNLAAGGADRSTPSAGAAGAEGATGAQGAGAKGATGAQGAPRAPGASGAPGTPRKPGGGV